MYAFETTAVPLPGQIDLSSTFGTGLRIKLERPKGYVSTILFIRLCNEDKSWWDVNPFSPNGDQKLISPHNITTFSNTQARRVKEMIRTDKGTVI